MHAAMQDADTVVPADYPELARLVEEFQRGHRLTVDGIAGVQTQVVLDALVGAPGTPTLGRSGG